MATRLRWAQKMIRRMRRHDPALTMRVEAGNYQIVRVTYTARGDSIVEPRSGWRPIPQ